MASRGKGFFGLLVHDGKKSVTSGMTGCWSHCIHTQEAESEQDVGWGYRSLRPTPRDPLPPANLHLLKVL